MEAKTDLTNKEIYGIYMRVMGQPIDPRDYRLVRKFARAVIEADRDVRKAKCDCELKGPCEVCGLIDGCSVGCGE